MNLLVDMVRGMPEILEVLWVISVRRKREPMREPCVVWAEAQASGL